MKIWDHFEYHIAKHYLPTLINGDCTGMEHEESNKLDLFEADAHRNAEENGFTVGHWDYDTDDSCNFQTCDVSGQQADVATVRLMVWKET